MTLTVYARQSQLDIYQFKIDVWSEKNSGIYKMRLDGFGYLRNLEATSPQEILLALHSLDPAKVEQEANQTHAHIRAALEAERQKGSLPLDPLPSSAELAVGEYFSAAQEAALKELAQTMEAARIDAH